jgi:hypothetical protein
VSYNGFIDVGLLEFELAKKINEVPDVVHFKLEFASFHCIGK